MLKKIRLNFRDKEIDEEKKKNQADKGGAFAYDWLSLC